MARSMKNILFSTTRQWNVGDEFIYHGIKRLFDDLGLCRNDIVFNRHPSIFRESAKPKLDNSFHLDRSNIIDYVVFAGSPAWSDKSSARRCVEFVNRESISCSFLGIGEHFDSLISEQMLGVFRNLTDHIVVRDKALFKKLKAHKLNDIRCLPCPALFSAAPNFISKRTKVKKVGLVFQADQVKHHNVTSDVVSAIVEFAKRIGDEFDLQIVSHYIDDFLMAKDLLPNFTHVHSSDSHDYYEIYKNFDLVISPRVHGCGCAASMGIPSYHIGHDMRGGTTEGFLSKSIAAAELSKFSVPLDVTEWSKELIEHRRESHSRYMAILSPLAEKLGRVE